MSNIEHVQKAIHLVQPDDPTKAVAWMRQWAPTGIITLTAADPEWRRISTISSLRDEALREFINEWNGKRGLFLQVNETVSRLWVDENAKPIRPSKEHIKFLRGLHIDMDVQTRPEVLAMTLESIRPLILGHTLKPSFINDTGGGFHAFYRFPVPLPATDENIALVEGLNAMLIEQLNGDKGTQNVDRILRVPFTVNIPKQQKIDLYGRVPVRVMPSYRSDNTVDVTTLKAIPVGQRSAPKSAASTKHDVVEVPPITDVEQLGLSIDKDSDWDLLALIAWTPGLGLGFEQPPELHDSEKQYLFELPGPNSSGKRSERVKAVVDRLLKRKVSAEKIVGTLMNPNWGLYEHINDKGGLRYAWHQLRHEAEPVRSPKLVPLTPIPDDLPPAPVLVPSLLLDGKVTVLGGRGGVGKSLMQIHAAVGVALGVPFLGYTPKEARRVLIINTEDDYREKQHRLFAVCKEMGVEPADLNDKLFTMTTDRVELFEAKFDDKGKRTIEPTPFCKELEELIKCEGIGLIMVDPLAEMHLGLDENSNMDMKELVIGMRLIAGRHNIPVMAAAHTRKGASSDGAEQDAIRGGGAIVNAARVAVLMEPMTQEAADRLLPKSANREEYVIVTDAKQNYFRRNGERVLQFIDYSHPTAGPRGAFRVPVFSASTPDAWEHTAAVLAEVQARMSDRPFSTSTTGPKDNRLNAWIEDNCSGTRKADVVGLIKALEAAGRIRRAKWHDAKRMIKDVWAVPGVDLPNEVGELPL